MKNFFKKIYNKVYLFFSTFATASKSVETQMLSQVGANSSSDASIVQDVNQHAHALSKALLKGEYTEEVQQLVYRNYKVDREAKKYKYFAPTLALKKKEGKDNKFVKFENADNLEVMTIQYNYALGEDILDAINQIDNGGRGNSYKYKIEIERNFVSRFKVEEFMKKIVVKRLNETHAILDMYFSKYPERFFLSSEDKSFRSKVFIHEIENIRDNGVRSDMLDIQTVRFVTSHAYKQDDLMEFKFRNVFFREVVEYDGDYILRFKAAIEKDGVDLTEPYYNKEMDEKYQTNAPKKVIFDVSDTIPIETYVCADCGKVVTFDAEKMNEMPISEARGIDEEVVDNGWNVTEYMDMQIVEQTIGKKLCRDCLKKYIDNRENKD